MSLTQEEQERVHTALNKELESMLVRKIDQLERELAAAKAEIERLREELTTLRASLFQSKAAIDGERP